MTAEFAPLKVSRHAVRLLIEGRPTRHQLRAKRFALQRLHDDIARFVGWPALCESLQRDMAAIAERMR